jgi:hypothetical protein
MNIPHSNVYEAIKNVMAEIGTAGISKDRNNTQQGYKFRGIDDVYNALNPVLARHGLILLPKVLERSQTERQSKSGSTLIYTTLTVQFTAAAMDGSMAEIVTVGEAMDSADKSSNKAMAAAYKYAAMMLFCIPTEGDNDADATTHELAPRSTAAIDKPVTKEETRALKDELCKEIEAFTSLLKLQDWAKSPENRQRKASLHPDFQDVVSNSYLDKQTELKEKVAA